jgi:hypothetical protein
MSIVTAFYRFVRLSGRSSAVERNLAKVEVVSSILIARSIVFGSIPRVSQDCF